MIGKPAYFHARIDRRTFWVGKLPHQCLGRRRPSGGH